MMKLFMIGASGYIGSVVADRVKADGHAITGMARSADAAAQLAAAGIEPVRGAMSDYDVLGEQAIKNDGVVQIATGGFLVQAVESVSESVGAADAILEALAGTDKPYVLTSGTGAYFDTGVAFPERVVTEADPISPPHFYAHLGDILRKVAATDDVRSIVLTPGQVYGRAGGYIGPIARLFNGVRKHGVVYAVAPGTNAITYVHVDDLADLYALALRGTDTSGTFIAATDTVTQIDVAKAVSRAAGLGGEVEFVDYPTMRELNGRASELDFWVNCRASSQKARDVLGWQPHRPGVIAELASLPKPLELNSVYPEPKRQLAAARVNF
jgi:nucleoside-diphosphate-sugar epimerase